MDLNELENLNLIKRDTPPDEYEPDGEEILAEDDILDALPLLNKCMHLLAYMGDLGLSKAIIKRDRDIMRNLANEVKEYLDEVVPRYSEE